MPKGRPQDGLRSQLQDEVLKSKGLVRVGGQLKFATSKSVGIAPSGKTLAMNLIEALKQQPIEELLDCSRKLEEISVDLGIRPDTVTRWRKRLGLKGGEAGRPRTRELKQAS